LSAPSSIPSGSREGRKARGRPGAPALLPRRREHSRQLEDADAEAFCRIYARVVLRIKGLAGLPKSVNAGEEVGRESA
jgi:hypothetical protein